MRSFKISVIKFLSVFALMLMLGTSIAFAQVSVKFPTVSGVIGTTKTVPITVGDLTGKNVGSYQFTLDYDENIIDITGIETEGTKSAEGSIQYNLANGKLLVAWANSTALTGSGTLLNIKVAFKAVGTSALDPLATFVFNTGNPVATITTGSATAGTIQVYVNDVSTSGLSTEFMIPVSTTTLVVGDNVASFDFTAAFDPTKIEITGYSLTGTKGEGGQAAINYNNTTGVVTFAWANATAITGEGVLVNLRAKAKAKTTSAVELTAFKFNTGAPVAVLSGGTITIANKAPLFGANQELTVAEGDLVEFTVVATDGDGDVLTYTAANKPAGSTFVGDKFTWTPTKLQAGTYTITFSATDGLETATFTTKITVTDVNTTPTITIPSTTYTVAEGQTLTIKATAADEDTDNTFTLSTSTLPSGASFVASTGTFTWLPTYAQAGTYSVTFTVKDNKNATASATAAITVTNNNNAPRFDVTGGKQMPDTLIKAGLSFVFSFKAIDPEGDAVTYFLQKPAPDNAIIVPTTGVFGWRPINTQAGVHYIIVNASDGILTTASRIAKVTVFPDDAVEENGLPTKFELSQNYPNPFNPTTNIKYSLPKESRVRLAVFNILGQEVATLINSVMPAGFHSVDFKASNLPSGMYIYKLETENFTQVKKMLLMK